MLHKEATQSKFSLAKVISHETHFLLDHCMKETSSATSSSQPADILLYAQEGRDTI